jgi:hypothetical protein
MQTTPTVKEKSCATVSHDLQREARIGSTTIKCRRDVIFVLSSHSAAFDSPAFRSHGILRFRYLSFLKLLPPLSLSEFNF